MSERKFHFVKSDDKAIAKAARKIARDFDPWGSARPWVYGIIFGAVFIASLDLGDVWICAGDCHGMIDAAKGGVE